MVVMKIFNWFKASPPQKINIDEFKEMAEVIIISAPPRKLDKILYFDGFGGYNDGSLLVCLYINGEEIPGRFWYSPDNSILRNGVRSEIVTKDHIQRYLETGKLWNI